MPELWQPKPLYGTCDDEILGNGGGWRHIDALTRLSIHESGHAVAHHVLGRDCAGILIFPSINVGVVYHNSHARLDALMEGEPLDAWPEEFWHFATICFAGPAAELRLMVERRGYRNMECSCWGDYEDVASRYSEASAIIGRLYAEDAVEPAWNAAKAFIANETNWGAVLALAEALRRHRRRRGGVMPGWRVRQILEKVLPRRA
jgi:hypothetical protein